MQGASLFNLVSGRREIYETIRRQRDNIRMPYIGNELKWNFLKDADDATAISKALDSETEYLIDWLEIRFNWLKSEFDKL